MWSCPVVVGKLSQVLKNWYLTIKKMNKSTTGMVQGKSIHVHPCHLRTVSQKTIHSTHHHKLFILLTTTIHVTHHRNTTKRSPSSCPPTNYRFSGWVFIFRSVTCIYNVFLNFSSGWKHKNRDPGVIHMNDPSHITVKKEMEGEGREVGACSREVCGHIQIISAYIVAVDVALL